jgi:hypothetical protein
VSVTLFFSFLPYPFSNNNDNNSFNSTQHLLLQSNSNHTHFFKFPTPSNRYLFPLKNNLKNRMFWFTTKPPTTPKTAEKEEERVQYQ